MFYNRKPEQFEGQRVLILGGGASGTDIAVEVAGKASKVVLQYVQWTLLKQNPYTAVTFVEEFQNSLFHQVYLAHNNPPPGSRMPKNVEQVDFCSMA